jgi:hypothetical protein
MLFQVEDSADRKFACEFPVRAQRVCIDRLHRWETRFEIEIEKRQQHLVAAEILALRRHASRMPERFLIGSLEPVVI